jgi:hypothetical protein
MKLLRIYIAVTCIISLCSCKKFIEDQKERAAMDFITSGEWIVESFFVDTLSVTNEFSGYNFRFHDNGIVTGTKDSNSSEGTWAADVSNYSISSNFPNATEPLIKLNGLWTIKDGGNDFVKADRQTANAIMHLQLRKEP